MPGSIRPRGNRFQASVVVPRSVRRSGRLYKTFKSERECNLWISDRTLAVEMGTFVGPSKMTVGKALEEFLDQRQVAAISRRTNRAYARRIHNQLGHMPIQAVNRATLVRFVAAIEKGPRLDGQPGVLMERTVDHIIRMLKAFFTWAKSEQHIAQDPAQAISRIRKPEGHEMVILTVAQTKAMLSAAHGEPVEAALYLAVTAGLRRGEVLGLRQQDVDLETGYLTVHHAFSWTERGMRLGRPKTATSRRTLKLTTEAVRALKRVRQDLVAKHGHLPDFVVPGPTGGPWAPERFGEAFRAFLRQSRFEPMRFHDLRHTHASHLIAAGVHVKVVSVRLGHADIQITMNLYGHILPGLEDGAVLKLEHLFGEHPDGPESTAA